MNTGTELANSLVKFQIDVQVIPKNRTAKIQTKAGGEYSYRYADLSDIWEAIRKPLNDNGLAVTQQLGSKEGFDGTGIYTKIWHKSGDSDEKWLQIPVEGKTPQESGSVITYYKRYALGAALGISTEEDDDGAAGNKKPEPPRASTTRPATANQLDLIKKLGTDLGKDEKWLVAVYDRIHSAADASSIIQQLKDMKKE
jgi:hypothetical protein